MTLQQRALTTSRLAASSVPFPDLDPSSVPEFVPPSPPKRLQTPKAESAKISRPRVYEKIRQAQKDLKTSNEGIPADVVENLRAHPLVKTAKKSRGYRFANFLKRLIHEGGDKIVLFSSHFLHVEYTRFITLCDQVKGLSLEKALLQLRWHQKPITKKFESALRKAIVKAKEDGLVLSKTYIADVYTESGAVISRYFQRRFIRGRGRYGATPQYVSATLAFTLQERDRPFRVRTSDPLEWIREKLRERQREWTPTVDEIYAEERSVKKIKPIYC
ncbi:hypothetical protein BJ742DRAFT_768357 [Cladochytrium replicatum]|nr:hypothetical protein BJ742DRAFT_768357 [Cladochytrium replicatum]